MPLVFHLDLDQYDADHRRAADWLAAQPDPTEAVVRLVKILGEGEQRLLQWEELATLLADEVRDLRSQLTGRAPQADEPRPDVRENPESARRLDSLFG